MFAITLLFLFGAVGFSMDYSSWVKKDTGLKSAADAGSLAGARELANAMLEHDDDNAVSRAEVAAGRYVGKNGGAHASLKVKVSATEPMGVVVELDEKGQQFFSQALLPEQPTIYVQSAANAARVADACVVALNPSATPGVEYNLSGQVVANNCSIWSNSTTATSSLGKGSGIVTADTNCSVGNAIVNGGLAMEPKARSNCLPILDPLADWSPPPTPWACQASNLVLDKPGNYTLKAGKYCGGITIKGGAKVTFEPGTYFIKGGSLSVEGGGAIYGDGVSFVFTEGAAVNLAGASVVRLSAPTSGPMAGMLLAAGRDEPTTNSLLRGSNEFTLEGYIYLPTHNLRYSGGPSGSHPAAYTSVIASTVKFDGSSRVEFRNNDGSVPILGARAFSHIYLTR